MHPKISIIIPCFNQGLFLNQTLHSVLQQTYSNWECLIIDDGSTDNSASIANTWCEKDNRFKLFQQENGGLSSARNLGLQHVSGRFIQFLDGDDLLYPDKLSDSLTQLNKDTDIIITSFNHLKKGKTHPPFCQLKQDFFNYQSILLQWDIDFSIPIHCGLFKSDILKDFRFNESVKAGEDWIFWLYIYKSNPITQFINKELVCYRLHEKSMTQDSSYMIRHKQQAHINIYTNLDDEHKYLFFERFSQEALERRTELFRLYENERIKKDKRISRRIKRFLGK